MWTVQKPSRHVLEEDVETTSGNLLTEAFFAASSCYLVDVDSPASSNASTSVFCCDFGLFVLVGGVGSQTRFWATGFDPKPL